jgi:hypothetical protein
MAVLLAVNMHYTSKRGEQDLEGNSEPAGVLSLVSTTRWPPPWPSGHIAGQSWGRGRATQRLGGGTQSNGGNAAVPVCLEDSIKPKRTFLQPEHSMVFALVGLGLGGTHRPFPFNHFFLWTRIKSALKNLRMSGKMNQACGGQGWRSPWKVANDQLESPAGPGVQAPLGTTCHYRSPVSRPASAGREGGKAGVWSKHASRF